jgi:hypothetical protein
MNYLPKSDYHLANKKYVDNKIGISEIPVVKGKPANTVIGSIWYDLNTESLFIKVQNEV